LPPSLVVTRSHVAGEIANHATAALEATADSRKTSIRRRFITTAASTVVTRAAVSAPDPPLGTHQLQRCRPQTSE